MRLTWLGWAGAELETDGATVVIDPLQDTGAVFAPLGDQAAATPLPRVVPPSVGKAVAGLVTHRQPASPLPVALDPAQAAIAACILGARQAVPIHAEGYEIDGIYQPVPDAAERFAAAAAERDVPVRILDPGETIEITAADTHHAPANEITDTP